MRPQKCRGSGDAGYIWRDGIFQTVYCICGAKITVLEDMLRVGPDKRYVRIPEHTNQNGKVQFVGRQ